MVLITFIQVRTYASLKEIMREFSIEDGTLAMVRDTSKLYLKVQRGWKEIQVTFTVVTIVTREYLCFYIMINYCALYHA